MLMSCFRKQTCELSHRNTYRHIVQSERQYIWNINDFKPTQTCLKGMMMMIKVTSTRLHAGRLSTCWGILTADVRNVYKIID